jgi:hypothetical protein
MTRRRYHREPPPIPAPARIRRLRLARDIWRGWAIATTILSIGLALAGMVADPNCLPRHEPDHGARPAYKLAK